MVAWGCVTIGIGFVENFHELVIARVFLVSELLHEKGSLLNVLRALLKLGNILDVRFI